jgi:hypothetical protein
MAKGPHERQGSGPELDHLHTDFHTDPAAGTPRLPSGAFGSIDSRSSAPRGLRSGWSARSKRDSRASRRAAFSSMGLVGVALAVLLAGGAMLSGASGSPSSVKDPLANAVRAVGGAPSYGPSTGMELNQDLVGIAATPSGHGYWAAAADGGVFTFGDARFAGSAASTPLVKPIVGIAATPSGNGYWLVASDGGVFSFGDAAFHGSIANPSGVSSPVVAIAATPSGNGYWLVGSDGGVFSFGDASFEGAATSFEHGAPITAIAPTSSGYGYYLLGADGGIFAFGDARFDGSAVDGQHLATGVAIPKGGKGYEIARSDGSIVGLGGAPSIGAPAGDLLAGQHPVVALATRPGGGTWLATGFVPPAPVAAQSSSLADDPFLKCTRAHESDQAGGYRAVSPGGVYRGAYQFLPSTWDNTARAAGRPDLVGVDPAAAAPADQDQVAMFLFHQAGPGPWGGRCQGLQ